MNEEHKEALQEVLDLLKVLGDEIQSAEDTVKGMKQTKVAIEAYIASLIK